MSQIKAQDEALQCTVCSGSRWQQSQDTFQQINDFVTELLLEIGYTKGNFKLIPIKQAHGSPVKREQKLRVTRVDGENALIFIAQLGSNNSAWDCRLVLPPGVNPSQLQRKMTDGLMARNERKPSKVEPPLPVIVQEEPAPTDTVVQATTVSAFVDDISLVALTIYDLFPKRHSHAKVSDFLDLIASEFQWQQDQAVQSLTALTARKHVKVLGHGALKQVCILDGELCKQLVTLGALREEDALSVAQTPSAVSVSAKARLRSEADKAYVGAPFRVPGVLGDTRPVKPPARLVETAAVVPPAPATSGTLSQLDELERKAKAFKDAQMNLQRSEPARTALAERRDRARQELSAVEEAQAKLDGECADALRVVSNPEYSTAAAKIDKIRAIMEE